MALDGLARRSLAMNDETDDQKRRTKRSRVLISATIRTEKGVEPSRLRNLSRSGALLEADAPPVEGSPVVFERGETVAPAHVAWVSGSRFGIQFDYPIEESEVLIHVGRPQPKPPIDLSLYKRTGLRPARVSKAERELGENWFNALRSGLGD